MKKTFIPLIAAALIVGAPIAHADKGPRHGARAEMREKVSLETQREFRDDDGAEVEDKSDDQNVFDKVRSLLRDKVEAKKLEIENEREGIQKQAEERRVKVLEARKEVKGEMVGIGIRKSAEKTTAMLNAMVERFEKLMDRISSRIEKITARGGDTKVSEEKLALAKTDLAKARAQIDDLKKIDLTLGSSSASTSASTTLRANFEAYKSAVKVVKDTFKLVHKDLTDSVRALKLGEVNVKTSATTTATPTGQ